MSVRTNEVRITRPGEGRSYNVLGAPIAVLSSGKTDEWLVADHAVPVGYQVPLHVHRAENEAAYVLDGAITFFTEAGEAVAGPGTLVHLPRGVAHGFANRGPVAARMLVMASAGGGLEGVFAGLDRAAQDGTLDGPKIGAVLADNGLELLLPV